MTKKELIELLNKFDDDPIIYLSKIYGTGASINKLKSVERGIIVGQRFIENERDHSCEAICLSGV